MGRTLTPLGPPFTNKALGRHLAGWKADLATAYAFCQEHDLAMFASDAPYQTAVLKGEGVQLLIYPHTTRSRGNKRNKNLRVRDEGSRDRDRATDLMLRLSATCPLCNTFNVHMSDANWQRLKEREAEPEDRSMASLVVEARLNAAMGEPVDDWLTDMYGDDIYEDGER